LKEELNWQLPYKRLAIKKQKRGANPRPMEDRGRVRLFTFLWTGSKCDRCQGGKKRKKKKLGENLDQKGGRPGGKLKGAGGTRQKKNQRSAY